MFKTVGIIPARMNSSRFPGKPLAPILGKPMIEHVFQRAVLANCLDAVYVATCDVEICRAVENFGGRAIMTAATHERASDRVAEAAEQLTAEIVVMIQGDEPLITPKMISEAVIPMLEDSTVECVNLVRRIENFEDFINPNVIKVVKNLRGDALYFSRAAIPAVDFTDVNCPPVFKQVCVIPFRREFLREFARLAPTLLEQGESIDMMRILEHGGRVKLVETEADTHAVDVPDDVRRVESLMKSDPFLRRYETSIEGARKNL